MKTPKNIFSYRKYWAHRFGIAPFLPMSRDEMDTLGWDSCDIILVSGDAYVDHASFGMAVIGRVLESQGFRVGIITQPNWKDTTDFKKLGKPNLYFGVTSGNMDSMVNRYTADRKVRSNDAYTPGGEGGRRPDRSVIVYSQRCREAFKDTPIIVGGIEASLRRVAHFDYWSEKVRRSILLDAKADLLIFGNAERQIVEISHRMACGESISDINNVRGTAFALNEAPQGWLEIDSSSVDQSNAAARISNPYEFPSSPCNIKQPNRQLVRLAPVAKNDRVMIRMPSFEQVNSDNTLYAHASRVLHLETNPGNAHALIQRHGNREVMVLPPPIPLTTKELDRVFELPFARRPHPSYAELDIPAWEMIRFSVNIMRGCFGGCTFCSITEHEGRIIQSRSEDSIIREIETIRDTTPGFTGVISDLGGPTANMYRLACNSSEIEAMCRRPSCVFPKICKNLNTDHNPLIKLYQRARKISGVRKILVASGLRYDLAVRSPEYVKELVSHHVGGYLKIAPEHTEQGPLSKMMKPGMESYYQFKELFDRFSKEAGKEQYLIPYFIAAHPGTTDKDMLNLALWLKKNGFRADQVQAFLPSPMATATAMYHTGKNPLHKVGRNSEDLFVPMGLKRRRLHKAFLRYHDPDNWPMLRAALKKMGQAHLIGNGKRHLVPSWQPATAEGKSTNTGFKKGKTFRTQQCHGKRNAGQQERRSKANQRKKTQGKSVP